MKMRKIFLVLGILSSLAACGGSGEGDISKNDNENSNSPEDTSNMDMASTADINSSEDINEYLYGEIEAGEAYDSYSLQCKWSRYIYFQLSSNDSFNSPTLEVYTADGYTQEEFDSAFGEYDYSADIQFWCMDNESYELRISDYMGDTGFNYTLYYYTGDICGEIVSQEECDAALN